MEKIYDMVIVGGGPGGYTAALYGARAGLSVVILERMAAGGQIAMTHQVDNYPGFAEGIDGFTLAENMQKQAHRFGAKTIYAEVQSLELEGAVKRILTDSGVFFGRTVVISTGASPRYLGLPREQELAGLGLHYCAACDGMFYRGKTVAVVGGGNSAVADALVLSRIAKKVILIHRRDSLRATKVYHESLEQAENVEILWNSAVSQLVENGRLTGIQVQNVLTGQEEEIACDGVFVSIGRQPASKLVVGQLAVDKEGYIIAGEDTATNIPGVYAVGDVRTKQVRQVVTAVSDGAIASHQAESYLAAQQATS